MQRLLKLLLLLIALVVIAYIAGPHPSKPIFSTKLPEVPASLSGIEAFVQFEEQKHAVKKDNEARIVWANDSGKQSVTDYALVYLHGFTASQEEGNPIHKNIAQKFGFNLYLPRLAEHGIDTSEALLNLTADALWESAKNALTVGKVIGKKVILMGTSTGASLALQLAATYPNDVAGVVLVSPNIAINNAKAWLLNNPWGLQLARYIKKSNYNLAGNSTEAYQQYWYHQYRLEGLVALEEYLEQAMTPDLFKRVQQPALCLYYYKDENHQDTVVKISAIKEMFAQLGTPETAKKLVNIPKADNHVICSPILSKDIILPQKEIESFIKNQIIHQ